MEIHHVAFATDGRRMLFPDEPARREAVCALGAAVRGRALLFCLVDDHVHVVLEAGRVKAGRIAQAVAHRLGVRASASLQAARIRPVESRAHLQALLRYVLLQPAYRQLEGHPALWTGSCLPELVGARMVPGLELRIGRHLPNLQAADVTLLLGIGLLETLSGPAVRALGPSRIVAAASAVLGVGPYLSGRSEPVVAARRLAAHAASEAGIAPGEIAWAMDVAARSSRRLLADPVDVAALRAIPVRLALEEAARSAPPLTIADEEDTVPFVLD